MKKLFICIMIISAVSLQFCSSSKNLAKEPPRLTYESDVQPLIIGNCSPCHIPPKGNKKAFNTYLPVKTEIDEIISRIKRDPSEKGFMPFKHPKLPDSTIQVFAKWKADGLLER